MVAFSRSSCSAATRGVWVDESHTAKGYQSDYDLLIIVNQAELTDRASYWYQVEDRLIRETMITHTLRALVNFNRDNRLAGSDPQSNT